MGLTVIPSNIGGVSLNSIASPLASLLSNPNKVDNLIFPSDLGSNPSLGHAVIFQAYDYKTSLGEAIAAAATKAINAVAAEESTSAAAVALVGSIASNVGPSTFRYLNAATYTPQKQQTPYTTISLFMPDTQTVNFNSHYEEVSLTKELGIPGYLAHAYSDATKDGLKNSGTPYAIATAGAIAGASVGSQNLGSLIAQSAGVIVNPQIQLLFTSVSLRTFQLEFLMTPKTSAEAQVVKNICDSFAFYSLPGIAGNQTGQPGQFLTPPQIFSVQFQFLGSSSALSQISNTLTSALNTTGLSPFLTTNSITGGTPAKTFSVNDCVLEDVNIDYAPNGWAAYNDGYPVQTRLTLQFKETTMITKNQFKNSNISNNYTNFTPVQSSTSTVATFGPNGEVNSAGNPNAYGGG
jgi:hypothetical protein